MSQYCNGNILLVSNYPSDTTYAWWLMEYFWSSIAEEFAGAYCNVYLAYPKITSISDAISSAPIEPVELTLPWKSNNGQALASQFIRDKNISVIYFTDQPYFKLQYARMKYLGVRHIIIHDHTPGDRPPVRGLKGTIKAIRNALPWLSADRVFCVSELMRKRNVASTRIPEKKCLVVQNGIQPVVCEQKGNSKLKKTLGLSDSSLLVVTTGRAHPYKRFDFIINCAAELKKMSADIDVVFLLIGDGPAMPELQQQLASLKLESTVILLGYRDDVRDLLCLSDIALHAALGEGFSLSIIEYMSASLPVLVPDIASVSQAVAHNETGLIYKKDDPRTAASYILELASDKQRRLAMGAAAKAKADSSFTLEHCKESLIISMKNSLS